MKHFLSFMLLLFVSAELIAQKVSESSFEMVRNYAFIKVSIGDSKPYNFVFDTGAAAIVLNNHVMEELDLNISREVEATGANGSVMVGEIVNQKLTIGRAVLEDMNLYATDLDHFEDKLGKRIDGIIGLPLILSYVVHLDYDQGLISFYEDVSDLTLAGHSRITVSWESGAPVTDAETTIHGRRLGGGYILDTGMNGAVSINTPYVRRYDLKERGKTLTHVTRGLASMETSYLTKAAELSIGGHAFKELLSELSDSDNGVSSGGDYVGLIGNAVLKRFNVTFDYFNSQVFLKANGNADRPFDMNQVGFAFKADDQGRVVVDEILARDRVDDAIQLGTELVTINDDPVSKSALLQIHELITKPGPPLQMTFMIDGKPRAFSIERKALL